MTTINLYDGITSERDALRVMDEMFQAYSRKEAVDFRFNSQNQPPEEILHNAQYPQNGFQDKVYSHLVTKVKAYVSVITSHEPLAWIAGSASAIKVSLQNSFDSEKVIAYWADKGLTPKKRGKSVSIFTTEKEFLARYGVTLLTVPYSVSVREDDAWRRMFNQFREMTKDDDITKLFK